MIWERNFKCDLNSLNHRGQPKQSQINIYTDGSKTRNHAGAGIAIIKHGNLRHTESIKLNPNVTIFQAEDGIRDVERSRGLGDVYKRQTLEFNLMLAV